MTVNHSFFPVILYIPSVMYIYNFYTSQLKIVSIPFDQGSLISFYYAFKLTCLFILV